MNRIVNLPNESGFNISSTFMLIDSNSLNEFQIPTESNISNLMYLLKRFSNRFFLYIFPKKSFSKTVFYRIFKMFWKTLSFILVLKRFETETGQYCIQMEYGFITTKLIMHILMLLNRNVI